MPQNSVIAACCWWLLCFGLTVDRWAVMAVENQTTTTPPPNRYHQLCNSTDDCDLFQVCQLMSAEDGPDGLRFCSCADATSWDPFDQLCRTSTYEQSCQTTLDCGWTQECIGYGYLSVCGCGPYLDWDPSMQQCRFKWCDEANCNASLGNRCYGLECRQCYVNGYDVCDGGYKPEPEQTNYGSSQSVPLIAIFGLFSASMMIVLLAWKCSVLRRLRQQSMGPNTIVVTMPNSASSHHHQQPQTPDDPPKYSNLVPPTWIIERDVPQRASSTAVNSDPLPTSTASAPHLPMDSPPPYTEIMIAPTPPTRRVP